MNTTMETNNTYEPKVAIVTDDKTPIKVCADNELILRITLEENDECLKQILKSNLLIEAIHLTSIYPHLYVSVSDNQSNSLYHYKLQHQKNELKENGTDDTKA